MKQEDKELLFKDICARLPYSVKVYAYYEPTGEWFDAELEGIDYINKEVEYAVQYIDKKCPYAGCTTKLKTYLRPMSSMTEEEEEEYCILKLEVSAGRFLVPSYDTLSWLNEHHFDYRGLIEKGLALEAPEGMYK